MAGLRVQLAFAFVGVAALSGALVGLPLYREATGIVEDLLVGRLASGAETAVLSAPVDELARTRAGGRSEAIDGWLAEVREEGELRDAWLVWRDGRTVGGRRRRELGPADQEALALTWNGEPAWTPTYRDPDGASIRTAYAPIDFDEDEVEDAALGIEGEVDALDRLAWLRTLFLSGALIGLGVVAAGAMLASDRLVTPVEALARAAASLARGEPLVAPPAASSTEIETLRTTFLAMAEAIHRREAWLRSLAGAVAHEIRTPANGARLHLGLLRRDLGAGAPFEPRLDVIEDQLGQLDEIVSSFVAFARDGAVVRRSVELSAWLAAAAAPAAASAPPARVEIDPVLLGRAVANLVRNAREAGVQPRVEARLSDGALRVSVIDQGRGFPPELVGRALEPFTTGRPDGTGLGLAIADAVVRAHGGRLWIERPGPGGTEVCFEVRVDGGVAPSAHTFGGDLPER